MRKVFNYMDMRGLYFLFLVCSLFGFGELKAQNPQLQPSIDNMPSPSACGEAVDYTVSIQTGMVAYDNIPLKVTLPQHFEYEPGGHTTTAGSISYVSHTANEVNFNLSIPAQTVASQMKVTFKLRTLCGAIATASLPAAQKPALVYLLNNGSFGGGKGQAINVQYAALRPEILPSTANLPAGATLERTINVRNNGTGNIKNFTLTTTLGSGLSLISSDLNNTSGWTVTETAPNSGVYQFTASSSATFPIAIKQTVKINQCNDINSTYTASYGCMPVACTYPEQGNATQVATIIPDGTKVPKVRITAIYADGSEVKGAYRKDSHCLDKDIEHIWKIENIGTAGATDMVLQIFTNNQTGYTGSSYLVANSYQLADNLAFNNASAITPTDIHKVGPNGDKFGTTDEHRQLKLPIGEVEVGKTLYLKFKLHSKSYLSTITCDKKNQFFRYGEVRNINTYKNANICSGTKDFTEQEQTLQSATTGGLTGNNVGDVMVSESQAYSGYYQFSEFFLNRTYENGDYFDLVLSLSPSFTLDQNSIALTSSTGTKYVPTIIPDGANKYRLRFTHGPSYNLANGIFTSNSFGLPNGSLKFDAEYKCGAGSQPQEAWYELSLETGFKASCPGGNSMTTKCQRVELTPTGCSSGCLQGLVRDLAKVERHEDSYGYLATNPDAKGLPVYPLQKVSATTSGVNPSVFITNDKIWVKQKGKVKSGTITEWRAGSFAVTVPGGLVKRNGGTVTDIVVPNSGRLVIKRGTDIHTANGLAVVVNGSQVTLNFTMADLHAKGVPASITHLLHDDQLEAAVLFKPNNFEIQDEGQKIFETDFRLIESGTPHFCGPIARANSLFVITIISGYAENIKGNIISCADFPEFRIGGNNPAAGAPYYRFNITVKGSSGMNAAFPNENRQTVQPKKFIAEVPEGLTLKGYYLGMNSQGHSSYNYYKVELDAPVSGATHTLNLEEALIKGLKARYSGATGDNASSWVEHMNSLNIDEGTWIRLQPIVTKNCKSENQHSFKGRFVVDGTFRYGNGRELPDYSNEVDWETPNTEIIYSTDNDKIKATIAQPLATSSTEQLSWVVKVENSSTFHTFANLWLGSTDATITSVQEASNASGANLIGNPFIANGGAYQLAATLAPLTTKFYVVTANIPDCGTGTRNLVFGHSCVGYPSSVTTPNCDPIVTIPISYNKPEGKLQSNLILEPAADYRPALCEELEYVFEINASAGLVKNLKVTIPLGESSGLTYVPNSAFRSEIYRNNHLDPIITIPDSEVTSGMDEITIKIPGISITMGEKIRFKLKIRTTDNCSFSSDQRIGFRTTGDNYCDSPILTPADLTSNRLIMGGDNTNKPILKAEQDKVTILFANTNAVGNAKGYYTFHLKNVGNLSSSEFYPIEAGTILAVKMPMGWAFDDANDIVTASNGLLSYQTLDVATNTYKYRFETALPYNGTLNFTDINLTIPALSTCPASEVIETLIYYEFRPNSVCSGGAAVPATCLMKKELIKVQTTAEVQVPEATLKTGVGTQLCKTSTVASLASLITQGDTALLSWYTAAVGGTSLTPDTPLIDNATYYVALKHALLGCESVNRTPVTITTVDCNPIVANDDVFPAVNGNVQSTAGNVLDNSGNGQDTLNGTPATTTNVSISEVLPATSINGNANVPKIDVTTGNVNVPAGTPAGTYTIVYRICESGNPVNNCDTAIVTVIVSTIEANDDDMSGSPVDGATGNPNLVNVLMNDTLNGVPNIPITEVTITVTTQATPIGGSSNVPVLDPATGNVSVPAGTPAGAYTITYQVCTKSTICDTANVVVVVTAQSIEAKDDSFTPITGVTGGTAGNVLSDNGNGTDTLGNVPATTANVDITEVTPASPINGSSSIPTLDVTTGDVNVPANTPAGTYTIVYRICEELNSTNCDTATATVVVNPTDLEAVPDDFSGTPIRGTNGGNTPSVLINDKLNGTPLNPSDVTLTWGATTPNGFTPNKDGTITIAPNTPAGTYTLTYTICEVLNPTNCETTTVTVVVIPDLIEAKDDSFAPVVGVTGGKAGNVLSDNGNDTDTLGNVPATTTNVDITEVTPASPINGSSSIPTLDVRTGDVNVPANTPAGTYTIVYRICEKLNPTNCDTATATVVVSPTDLEAVPDDFSGTPIRGTDGGNTPSVLTNDKLNGTPLNPSDVTLTWGGTTPNGFTPNTDGTITIAPNTPAGTYTLTYTICEKLNPTNCETTTVTVLVTASPIVANDDDYTMYPIYTTVGGTVSTSVLINDTFEGVTATLGTVTISNPTTPNTNIYIDTANGMVVVLPNTPVGTYTLTYTICEKANPTNCSNQANVTVVVLDVPKANDDSATTEINTPVAVNILENDQNVPTTGRVSVVSDPSRGSVQVNDGGTPNDPSDDIITYTPNLGFVGTDTFVYELCDVAGNCSNATVTIEVVAGGDIIPYNAISTNDDGSNDIFYIKGIEGYPNNTVRIYNRWGVKVFEAQGYNNTTKVFRGLSNGRVTIEAPEKLPQGTYYYIIEYVDKNNQTKRKGSWLYIKN
ncbi:gliding motility-associated C-terminal domain-containing protein [Capnocytophaga cynodegmi]|uniref:T9SS type B sorting domain-containing protein n=1 Tax=Capnocytophaga cynodegmi TaxID=28189 RepID=UPI0037D21AA9